MRTGICIAVRHGTNRTNATAHILPIRTGPRLSGGATGKQAIRGRSTRKANGHFLLLSCRHGTGGSRPCGNSVTKNAPGVMQSAAGTQAFTGILSLFREARVPEPQRYSSACGYASGQKWDAPHSGQGQFRHGAESAIYRTGRHKTLSYGRQGSGRAIRYSRQGRKTAGTL